MLSPDLKAKLADPAVKQAISYWVMFVVNQLGAVRSEKEIKQALFHKLGKRVSPIGIDYIYTLALSTFEESKGIIQPIITEPVKLPKDFWKKTRHGNN